jgi:hypothetical protein
MQIAPCIFPVHTKLIRGCSILSFWPLAGTSPGTNDEQKDANRLLMAAASQLAAPRGPRHLRAAA